MRSSDLISVIIPAYNAERYIARTLDSVIGQSYRNFETIVVDDGSEDGTAEIVSGYASKDSRIQLAQQRNQGVAAARNTGIRLSRGAYLAPLDADDLWDSRKLEKQLALFGDGTRDLGLVYALYRAIDEQDVVTSSSARRRPEGWVFLQHANENFIGNGSSILATRKAVEDVGGYSSRLRLAGAEGAEDVFLQLSIASKYRFGVVPEYLVGYRRAHQSMSSNALQMAISTNLVLESFLKRCSPAARAALQQAVHRSNVNIVRLAITYGAFRVGARGLSDLASHSPRRLSELPREFWSTLIRKMRSRWPKTDSRRSAPIEPKSYWDYSVVEMIETATPESDAFMAELQSLDNELGPKKGYLISSPENGSLANQNISDGGTQNGLTGSTIDLC